MRPRDAARVLACVGLALSLLVPTAWSGSSSDPEIEDGCGDVGNDLDEALDLAAAWVRDPIFEEDELVLELCGDQDTDAIDFRERAGSEGFGWIFAWADEDDRNWEIRVVAYYNPNSINPTIPEYRQHTCRDGEELGTSRPVDPYPTPDGNRFILNAPTGRFSVEKVEIMEQLHAEAGRYDPAVRPGLRGCDTGVEVADRAPDDGFGDAYRLAEPEQEGEGSPGGVVVATPDSRVVVPRGESGNWTLNLTRQADEGRNVTLDVATDANVTLAFENTTFPLLDETEARTNLTVDVPLETPLETFPVAVRANVTDAAGDPLEPIVLDLNLTVIERLQKVEIGTDETIRTVAPGNRTTFPLRVDNVGSGNGTWDLSAEGPAAGWMELPSSRLDLGIGDVAEIDGEVAVPDDAELGLHHLSVVARSNASDATARLDLRVSVQEFVDDPGDLGRELPAPGVAAVALAAAAAAWTIRRRRR